MPASAAPSQAAVPASEEGKAPIAAASAPADTPAQAAAAEPASSFESHMEMVKLRLKAGYYSGSNMDEALSDRLTGYFDELA